MDNEEDFLRIKKSLNYDIEFACRKLKYSVSDLELALWLDNFDSGDQKEALYIFKNLEYFNERDIIAGFCKSLKSILTKEKNVTSWLIHPIGKFGKSGTAMTYYFNKSLSEYGTELNMVLGSSLPLAFV